MKNNEIKYHPFLYSKNMTDYFFNRTHKIDELLYMHTQDKPIKGKYVTRNIQTCMLINSHYMEMEYDNLNNKMNEFISISKRNYFQKEKK